MWPADGQDEKALHKISLATEAREDERRKLNPRAEGGVHSMAPASVTEHEIIIKTVDVLRRELT